jgi:predicted Zn finger-like uncharacterized protein
MGKFLGVVFIVFALISLIAFTALDPDNNDDRHEEDRFLAPKDEPDSTHEHERYANRGNEIRLTFTSSDGPIRITVRNRDDGDQNEHVLTEASESGEFDHSIDSDGNYVIRFENRQDRGTNVHYTTSIRNNDNEAPRAICGMLTVIFLILGIIFLARKGRNKDTIVIQARQMLHPQAPPNSHPGTRQSDTLTPRSPFAPSPSDPKFRPLDEQRPIAPSPEGDDVPAVDRGISSSTRARSESPADDSLGYGRSRKPAPSFPLPKDTSRHESHFRCPDCGTVIFINRKIRKVKCPKCSHTFRVEKRT